MISKMPIYHGHHRRFPTLAVILLVVGITWLLSELKLFTVPVPWWPVVLIIVAIGMIINRYVKN